MTTKKRKSARPLHHVVGRCRPLIKPDFDTVSRKYYGKSLVVKILEHEVAGYVDGTQVYGIYFDRGEQGLRSSMAKAPSGKMKDSFADILCMKMVMEVVYKMIPPNTLLDGNPPSHQYGRSLPITTTKETT